ncbi:TM2 domain-containing protein [Chloroflexota bacterium]
MRQIKVEEISSKSKLVTVLLALFLGIFGTHRFYIGKIRTAIVMLFLSILYLVAVYLWEHRITLVLLAIVLIWAFIDLIFAVSGIMKDREGKRIKDWAI